VTLPHCDSKQTGPVTTRLRLVRSFMSDAASTALRCHMQSASAA